MKRAFLEESNVNSQMDILRMNEVMNEQDCIQNSDILTFENKNDAIQYLSNLLKKQIKIMSH